MKTKFFAAALAALVLGAALPAAAQDFRGGDRDFRGGPGQDFRGGPDFRDWRGRGEITIRQNGRTFTFDRRDRMFYRLMDRPFRFQPGLTYAYTDHCNRAGCQVIVFSQRSRRPVDTTFAPRVFDRFDARWDDRQRNGGWDYRGSLSDDQQRGWNQDRGDQRGYDQGQGYQGQGSQGQGYQGQGSQGQGYQGQGPNQGRDRQLDGAPRR